MLASGPSTTGHRLSRQRVWMHGCAILQACHPAVYMACQGCGARDRHTNGHICFLCREEGSTAAVFTGDTLFVGGCGRCAQLRCGGARAPPERAFRCKKSLGLRPLVPRLRTGESFSEQFGLNRRAHGAHVLIC